MNDLEFTEAEKTIAEELSKQRRANNRRVRTRNDRLKAERAKDYIRFPVKGTYSGDAESDINLRRVKRLKDLPPD